MNKDILEGNWKQFSLVPPAGEIKVRELIAHKAVQIRTYGEYNQFPKLLEMWNALGRTVNEQNL